MDLETARECSEAIAAVCNDEANGIAREMASFNYVYNYLDNWASETVVGADVRERIRLMNAAITELKNKTVELCTVITDYVDSQSAVNNGN